MSDNLLRSREIRSRRQETSARRPGFGSHGKEGDSDKTKPAERWSFIGAPGEILSRTFDKDRPAKSPGHSPRQNE